MALKRKYVDPEICPTCRYADRCDAPCSPVGWIDGNKERKEPLLREVVTEYKGSEDYNAIIAEHIEHDNCRKDKILSLHDLQQRAIYWMLEGNFSYAEMSALWNVTRKTLYNRRKKKGP